MSRTCNDVNLTFQFHVKRHRDSAGRYCQMRLNPAFERHLQGQLTSFEKGSLTIWISIIRPQVRIWENFLNANSSWKARRTSKSAWQKCNRQNNWSSNKLPLKAEFRVWMLASSDFCRSLYRSEAPLIQKRGRYPFSCFPRGSDTGLSFNKSASTWLGRGPSKKTWPKCDLHRLHRHSTRRSNSRL